MKYCLLVIFLFACSTTSEVKKTETQKESVKAELHVPNPSVQAEAETGKQSAKTSIKNSENVPSFTREELAKKYAVQRKCIDDCIQSRQPEAIAPEMIEQQCTRGCMEKHFVGQVGIKPESEKLKKAESKKPE